MSPFFYRYTPPYTPKYTPIFFCYLQKKLYIYIPSLGKFENDVVFIHRESQRWLSFFVFFIWLSCSFVVSLLNQNIKLWKISFFNSLMMNISQRNLNYNKKLLTENETPSKKISSAWCL